MRALAREQDRQVLGKERWRRTCIHTGLPYNDSLTAEKVELLPGEDEFQRTDDASAHSNPRLRASS